MTGLSGPLKLDIGCGEGPKKGDVGVDLRKTTSVDIVADAPMLPFKDESFDHIYSSHLIEHFSHREVKNVLAEWIRVLKKHGVIEIRCPDLRARPLIFSKPLMAKCEEYIRRARLRG
ncbi:MAG: class I SAM-dependent methyltransferase [Candidatus Bathyarchaeia archaeon]|nr:class I SAM-dependent methyltransferase [Candidatus Bathyarchaeia archaeon]